MLDLLKATQYRSTQPITIGAKVDVGWFLAFLPVYNGITLISEETAQVVVAQVDACPLGASGICAGWQYYSVEFPPAILQCQFSIASLECYNILVACRLWMQGWAAMHILLYSDNWASVCALDSGVAADPSHQGFAPERSGSLRPFMTWNWHFIIGRGLRCTQLTPSFYYRWPSSVAAAGSHGL